MLLTQQDGKAGFSESNFNLEEFFFLNTFNLIINIHSLDKSIVILLFYDG